MHVRVDVVLLLHVVHENHVDEGLLGLLLQPEVALVDPFLVGILFLVFRVVSVYLVDGLGVQHLADHVAHVSVFDAVLHAAPHDGGDLRRDGVAEGGFHAAEKVAPRGVVVRLEAHRERLVGGGQRERAGCVRLNGY